jgi:hypothetical protein
MKSWTQPQFEELAMNAEIGAYQPDTGDERAAPVPPTPLNALGNADPPGVADDGTGP